MSRSRYHAKPRIAALLRHSTTALVKRYAHLSPSHLKAAVEGVAGFGKVPAGIRENRVSVGESDPVSSGTVTETGTPGSAGERSVIEVVEKLVPPIRIERTTNGLGNRDHTPPTPPTKGRSRRNQEPIDEKFFMIRSWLDHVTELH
jgi:hypothetical protein